MMNRSLLSMFLLLSILPVATSVAQQDLREQLRLLRDRQVAVVSSAIEAIEERHLVNREVVQRLSLLLDDKRSIQIGNRFRCVLSEEAYFKLCRCPSGSVDFVVETLPALNTSEGLEAGLRVVRSIGKVDASVHDAIRPYLTESEGNIRAAAVYAIAAVGRPTPETATELLTMLSDADPFVRWATLESLPRFSEHLTPALPRIVRFLDSDETVNIAFSSHAAAPHQLSCKAATALLAIGPDAQVALPSLRKLVINSNDVEVRAWAAAAICTIADAPSPEMLEVLREILINTAGGKDFLFVDITAAIAAVGPRAAPLLETLEDARDCKNAGVRTGLAHAFFSIDPETAVSRSLPLAADSDDLVAAETIREFSARDSKDTRVLLAYIMTLKQYDPLREYATREAVAALGKLGPAAERAVSFLEILAKNQSVPDGFRKEIEVALQKIR